MRKFKNGEAVIVLRAPPGIEDPCYPKSGRVVQVPQNQHDWYAVSVKSGGPLAVVQTYRVPADFLAEERPRCPVCGDEITVRDCKVGSHGANGRLCYGSFMPV